MCGYEILCSNGARRGREIIINPVVGCFLIRQLAVFYFSLGTTVTTVLEQLCQMGIQFSIENCNQIMTVWGVLLYIENGLFY